MHSYCPLSPPHYASRRLAPPLDESLAIDYPWSPSSGSQLIQLLLLLVLSE